MSPSALARCVISFHKFMQTTASKYWTILKITIFAVFGEMHRVKLQFSMGIWNMFHRTQHELHRTKNSKEGWNRAFQAHVSVCHPTIYRFLDILKSEESMARVSILEALGRHPPPPVRRRYVDCNERILRIVDNFPNMAAIRYLRSIACNWSR